MSPEEPKLCALLSPSEWAIECGRPACGAVLVDVAWVDINFNMVANGPGAGGPGSGFTGLPPEHLRRYRMAVMLPPQWSSPKGSNSWSFEGTAPRATSTSPKARVVRGGWNVGQLGEQGVPPFDIVCYACGTLQHVVPHRRTGTPPPPPDFEKPALPGRHPPPSP